MITLLLAACTTAGVADRYADALAAPDFESGWAGCELLQGELRADCRTAVATRFARFESCARMEPGPWREECVFASAEHLARAKDRPAALRTCRETRFADNCVQHVLDGLAMDLRDRDPEVLEQAWEGVASEVTAPNAELDVWRSWHRVRWLAGMVPEAGECPNTACRDGARAEVRRAVETTVRADGCDAAAATPWPAGSDAARWADQFVHRACPTLPAAVVPARVTE